MLMSLRTLAGRADLYEAQEKVFYSLSRCLTGIVRGGEEVFWRVREVLEASRR